MSKFACYAFASKYFKEKVLYNVSCKYRDEKLAANSLKASVSWCKQRVKCAWVRVTEAPIKYTGFFNWHEEMFFFWGGEGKNTASQLPRKIFISKTYGFVCWLGSDFAWPLLAIFVSKRQCLKTKRKFQSPAEVEKSTYPHFTLPDQ